MRKVILTSFMMVFCVILSAQNYNLNGKIGNEKASFIIKKAGSSVKGKVWSCPTCIPIEVEGTWKGNNISLTGYSEAGSQLSYTLTVDGNIVKGTESLWAEGEEENYKIDMTISMSSKKTHTTKNQTNNKRKRR
jgi:hypothetical protein